MVLTTGRVVIALAAFGVLYLLQSRSRKVSDDFLRKLDQRQDRAGNLELERQRAQEYEQFESKNEKAQRAAWSDRTEAETGEGERLSLAEGSSAELHEGGSVSAADSARSVHIGADGAGAGVRGDVTETDTAAYADGAETESDIRAD